MREEEHLKELASFFKRTSAKIKLIKLISKAKQEYDNYNYSESEASLKEAYKIDSENPAILRGLGCVNLFRKDFDKAFEFFNSALQKSGSKEIEYTLLGMACYLNNQLDEAVKYFNLAIDENDDYTPAYEGRNQTMLENHLKIADFQELLKKYF